jgi:hypothetical protein
MDDNNPSRKRIASDRFTNDNNESIHEAAVKELTIEKEERGKETQSYKNLMSRKNIQIVDLYKHLRKANDDLETSKEQTRIAN